MEGKRCLQVRQLFAEGVCQPRKPPHLHSHCEVVSLHHAGGNEARFWVARHDLVEDAHNAAWEIGPGRTGPASLLACLRLAQLFEVTNKLLYDLVSNVGARPFIFRALALLRG